jgi:hypothetical protein
MPSQHHNRNLRLHQRKGRNQLDPLFRNKQLVFLYYLLSQSLHCLVNLQFLLRVNSYRPSHYLISCHPQSQCLLTLKFTRQLVPLYIQWTRLLQVMVLLFILYPASLNSNLLQAELSLRTELPRRKKKETRSMRLGKQVH